MTFDGNGHSIIGRGMGSGPGRLSIGCDFYAPTPIVTEASNVAVENFTVTGSVLGIALFKTSNALVANNTILGTGNGFLSLDESTAGIFVEGGGSNIITGNSLVNNYDGMSFLETENNLIVRNNITNSSNTALGGGTGIAFWGSSNNTIYHNNFLNNPVQAYDDSFNSPFSVNIWDEGYPGGGNYWSDYQTKYSNAAQIDGSGIGNTSYVIDSQNKDRYPLMEPFNTTPPKISLLSPLSQIYNESAVPLVFTIDKAVNWEGYSLDGKPNVTITGNDTIANITNGLHSVTVYANGTFGDIGASTITFTIAKPEPFPTATVAAALVVTAIVIGVGLTVYFKRHHP